jgi:hypothetical protein
MGSLPIAKRGLGIEKGAYFMGQAHSVNFLQFVDGLSFFVDGDQCPENEG